MREVTVFDIQLRAMADADAILSGVGLGAVLPQAVGDMHMSPADTRTALTAAVVPPAVDEGGIQARLCSSIATAPHRAASVVVALVLLRPGGDEIGELTDNFNKMIKGLQRLEEVPFNVLLTKALQKL